MQSARVPQTKGHGCESSIHPLKDVCSSGFQGVDVGNRLKVRLIHTDVETGFYRFQ